MHKQNSNNSRTILFLVTEDWYFCSHRLALGCALKKVGYDVVVATRVNNHGDIIVNNGLRLIPLGMRRRSKNIFIELMSLIEIWSIYRREKPDIIHHVALKPVLYGTFVSLFFPKVKVVNAIAGLGFIFTSKRKIAFLLRPLIMFLFRYLLNRRGSKVIVQNPDDRNLLVNSLGMKPENAVLIRGAGVNIFDFKVAPEPPGEVVVVVVARMLWDKGIGEFVNAVRKLKDNGLKFRAELVGSPDNDNLTTISSSQLKQWNADGCVVWRGHTDNVANVLVHSHLSVLPSYYGEGIPKSLIEAAACGRPIITTDTPGCREIVENNVNGLLVPPRDVDSLADAMSVLIQNKVLREEMGRAGREKVEKYFSEEIVIEKTLSVYKELLE